MRELHFSFSYAALSRENMVQNKRNVKGSVAFLLFLDCNLIPL